MLRITCCPLRGFYRIPLSGEAEILLPDVDSLAIQRGAGNAMQLGWAPVTRTISGRPYSPAYYVIYGATTPSGPWVPIDMSPTSSYTHLQFSLRSQFFYQVSAGTDEVRALQRRVGCLSR